MFTDRISLVMMPPLLRCCSACDTHGGRLICCRGAVQGPVIAPTQFCVVFISRTVGLPGHPDDRADGIITQRGRRLPNSRPSLLCLSSPGVLACYSPHRSPALPSVAFLPACPVRHHGAVPMIPPAQTGTPPPPPAYPGDKCGVSMHRAGWGAARSYQDRRASTGRGAGRWAAADGSAEGDIGWPRCGGAGHGAPFSVRTESRGDSSRHREWSQLCEPL